MLRRLLFVAFLALSTTVNAQYWEIGPFIGASNYNGEFSESSIIFKETHGTIGGVVRLNMNRHFSLKGNLYYGKISGTDQNADKYYHRRTTRNLHFQSNIMDISIQPEWNILGYRTASYKYNHSPYLFTGISIFRFSPEAEYNGQWVALQPLGTEGQYLPAYEDRAYKLVQYAIPMGVGWKFSLGGKNRLKNQSSIARYINIGIEFSARMTFTDYLDDVSNTYVDAGDLLRRNGQIAVNLMNRTGEVNEEPIIYEEGTPRGSPNANDWYYFGGITITYSFLPVGCMGF